MKLPPRYFAYRDQALCRKEPRTWKPFVQDAEQVRDPKRRIEYISLPEVDEMLREERAKAFEEAAKIAEESEKYGDRTGEQYAAVAEGIKDDCLALAKAARERNAGEGE